MWSATTSATYAAGRRSSQFQESTRQGVYRSPLRISWRSARRMLEIARQIVRHRGLLKTLVGRELKARYRGSLLGFFWSLVNPALLVLVYSLVFGLILRPRLGAPGTEPYALFLISGLFPWIWFSTSLLEATGSLAAGAGLLRKAV